MENPTGNPIHDFSEPNACLTERGYEVLDCIGWGHFAACYRIRDRRYPADLFCAKVIALTCEPEAESPLVTYETELGTLMKLTHPHIITVYAGFSSPNYCYLILEYCQRGTLRRLISANSGLSETDFVNYARQLAGALAYLHERNVCHRDIKPGNVLIDKYGRAKLADFGLAVYGAHTAKYCGSLGYMSPELLERRSMDAMANDIWALGITFYEMVFGQRPWQCQRIADLIVQITSGLLAFPADVPGPLVATLRKMLSLDPSRRPPMKWVMEQPFFSGIRSKSSSSSAALPILKLADGKGLRRASGLTSKPKIITPAMSMVGPSLLLNVS
jgi:serine/threonine protein kinase